MICNVYYGQCLKKSYLVGNPQQKSSLFLHAQRTSIIRVSYSEIKQQVSDLDHSNL